MGRGDGDGAGAAEGDGVSDKYTLGQDHRVIPEPDLITWARWFETGDRRVALTEMADGAFEVSTVFLGLDHRFGEEDGPPLLFETMVFRHAPEGGRVSVDGYQERYGTWDDAIAGHARIVAALEQRRQP